ncbi:MAG: hypothetical protein ABIQ44_13170, partial [Chloroflexia bacterium]
MSTGTTPNPPDRATNVAPKMEAPAQELGGAGDAGTMEQAPFDLAEDLAGIISGQADVLAQRLVYHCQTMFGVGAMSVDIVNARNSVLVFANSLRNKSDQLAVGTLTRLGSAQNAQINDTTLPFKNNSQVAGLLEGLLIDAAMTAYRDDAGKQNEARLLLDSYSQAANEHLQRQTRALGPVSSQGAQG